MLTSVLCKETESRGTTQLGKARHHAKKSVQLHTLLFFLPAHPFHVPWSKRAWAYQRALENTISLIRVQKWNRRENKEWKGREHNKGENWHKPLLLLEVERVYWISSKIHFIFSIRSDWYTLWRFMPCCHCFFWPIWWLWSCSNIQREENKCAFSLERRTHMFSAWQIRFIWRRRTHKNGSA